MCERVQKGLVGLTICLMLWSAELAWAERIPLTGPPGTRVVIDRSGDPYDADMTAVVIEKKSVEDGFVTVEWFPGSPLEPGDAVAGGFQLIDVIGTNFKVEIEGVTQGSYRVRYRVALNREDLRRSGLDINTARLLRKDKMRKLWRPAWQAISRSREADLQRKMGPATFVLGNYGVDPVNHYVWAVLDVDGEFGVGALVPEPAGALVGLLGAAGLLMHRARRPENN